jgi:hypothetical protein
VTSAIRSTLDASRIHCDCQSLFGNAGVGLFSSGSRQLTVIPADFSTSEAWVPLRFTFTTNLVCLIVYFCVHCATATPILWSAMDCLGR